MSKEPDKDTQDFIDKDDELKYALMIEKKEYAKIPTDWLTFYLEKSETNLRGYENLGIERPQVSTTLKERIQEIKTELSKRK